MDANQYASLTPMDSDHLLEKVSEYQREIDAHQSNLDDLKEQVSDEKKAITRYQGKIALVARSQESGTAIYQLDGGELTDEMPEGSDNVLPFHKGGAEHEGVEEEAPVEEAQDVVDLGEDHPEGTVEEPAEEEADVTGGL